MTTEATIHERGNGFPEVGDYVPGNDGNLYRLMAYVGQIQTGRSPGASNWSLAEVELADWDDVADEDVFDAVAATEADDNDVEF